MAARLGQVLYWIGCGLTLAILLFMVWNYFHLTPNFRGAIGDWLIGAAFAMLPLRLGRAALYILAGR